MAKPNAKRLTLRQMRLAAWMRDPQPPPIADERIDWRAAFWSAQHLVESSGVYEGEPPSRARRQCLSDLAVLVAVGWAARFTTGDVRTGRPVWKIEAQP